VRSSVIVSFIAEIYHLNSGLQVADHEEITIFYKVFVHDGYTTM
jgi:hypothetical protein